MQKVFVVVMNYEENKEDMFTDVGVEVAFDNQLFELKEAGFIGSYDDTEAYDVDKKDVDKILKIVRAE